MITSSRPLLDTLAPTLRNRHGNPIVVNDSIDTDAFAPREPDYKLKARLGIESDSPVAVYLGSLDHLQGIDLLLRVAKRMEARVPAMKFLIMGGPEESSWRQRFHGAEVRNCIFTGVISREEAPRHLSLGIVAVSLKRSDSMQANGKLLDYMAMGLPVVAFDTLANREILGDKGCLVSEGDTDRVTTALESLAGTASLRRELGEALRTRAVALFSREVRGNELIGLYREMVESGEGKKKTNRHYYRR